MESERAIVSEDPTSPTPSHLPLATSGFSWPMLGRGYSHDDFQTRTTGATTYSLTQVEDHQDWSLFPRSAHVACVQHPVGFAASLTRVLGG
jgi:hypothetical protein